MLLPTIVVHVDATDALDLRAEVAAKLALKRHWKVTGVCSTGLPPFGSPSPGEMTERYRAAIATLERFADLMQRHGIAALRRHLSNANEASALVRVAGASGLVIMSHPAADTPGYQGSLDRCEFVVLNAPCPVLIVGARAEFGTNILVAYDGSVAALHTLAQARGFLAGAQQVTLATFGTGPNAGAANQDAAIGYLKSVGIEPEVRYRETPDVGTGLAALADEINADLIVMGGSAHPRWHQVLHGGCTGFMLEHTNLALLMSH